VPRKRSTKPSSRSKRSTKRPHASR
jgi:hypothetical protein